MANNLKGGNRIYWRYFWLVFWGWIWSYAGYAQTRADQKCPSISGEFNIEGTQEEEGGKFRRNLIYLEGPSGGITRALGKYFRFQFNPLQKRVEVVVFDSKNIPVFRYESDSNYLCIGGQVQRSDVVDGGGEGCSQSVRGLSTITLDRDGSLLFQRRELVTFAPACMKGNMEILRTTRFTSWTRN